MKLGAKYAVVFLGALSGLVIGHIFGPAGDLAMDWDFTYPRWLSEYVYYHHSMFVGNTVSLFALLAAQIVRGSIWSVIVFSVFVALIGNLAAFFIPCLRFYF